MGMWKYNPFTHKVDYYPEDGDIDHGGLAGLTDVADHPGYLLLDGTRALTGDWDIGDGRHIEADEIRARDNAGLKLYDDGGLAGIFVQDGGYVGIGIKPNNFIAVSGLINFKNGDYCTHLGYQAGASGLTNYNTFVGYETGRDTTHGHTNTALGMQAFTLNASGCRNTAIGATALVANTTAIDNVAVGVSALYYNQSGRKNIAVGNFAGWSGVSASGNVMLGHSAGLDVTTGSNNICIGYLAGDNLTTGDNNIIIGSEIDAPSAAANNQMYLGGLIYGDLSNLRFGVNTTSPLHAAHVSGTTELAGGLIHKRIKKSAGYTTVDSDYIVGFDTVAASGTITLGSVTVKSGRTVVVKDEGGNASTNFITIATEGSEKIDGVDTKQIIGDYGSIAVYSDGTTWFVV